MSFLWSLVLPAQVAAQSHSAGSLAWDFSSGFPTALEACVSPSEEMSFLSAHQEDDWVLVGQVGCMGLWAPRSPLGRWPPTFTCEEWLMARMSGCVGEEKLWEIFGKRELGASVKPHHLPQLLNRQDSYAHTWVQLREEAIEDPVPRLEIRWPIMQKESRPRCGIQH